MCGRVQSILGVMRFSNWQKRRGRRERRKRENMAITSVNYVGGIIALGRRGRKGPHQEKRTPDEKRTGVFEVTCGRLLFRQSADDAETSFDRAVRFQITKSASRIL